MVHESGHNGGGYAVRTRNGFTPATRMELFKRLNPLEIQRCLSLTCRELMRLVMVARTSAIPDLIGLPCWLAADHHELGGKRREVIVIAGLTVGCGPHLDSI